MFAGTHQAAQNAAIIYSLFATCKKYEVNPQHWLLNVLRKLNDQTVNSQVCCLTDGKKTLLEFQFGVEWCLLLFNKRLSST